MGLSRWLGLLGPPVLLVVAIALLAATFPLAIAAAPRPSPPGPTCPSPGSISGTEIARLVRAGSVGARVSTTARLSPRGEETGRQVLAELADGRQVDLELPAESFVAAPLGGVLLYGWHDGSGSSEVRMLDLTNGCEGRLVSPAGALRSATIDPQGAVLYVHTVSEPDRHDAGITRYDLATGERQVVLAPLAEADHFGPTFGTSLVWSVEGDELAVQSCGFSRCRTRVLEVASGLVETHAGEGHGQLIGFTREALIAFGACHWAPCELLALERPSGTVSTLVEEAYDASLTKSDDQTVIQVETATGTLEVAP